MATPLTAAQQIAALKKWGIPYREVTGWETRNRAGHGAWGPVHGFMVHHTGDDAPDSADRSVLVNGRSDLPGPLVQFGLDHEGVIELIGNGRCNHAGGGDPAVLNAVIHESYASYPPAPRYHEGSPGEADGNAYFYGVETYYSGGHAMNQAQHATLVRLAAAICDAHGWTSKSVIGHKEWSDWKVDPGFLDMHGLRTTVDAALKAGPNATRLLQSPKPATSTNAPAPINHRAQVRRELQKVLAGPDATYVRNHNPRLRVVLATIAKLARLFQ